MRKFLWCFSVNGILLKRGSGRFPFSPRPLLVLTEFSCVLCHSFFSFFLPRRASLSPLPWVQVPQATSVRRVERARSSFFFLSKVINSLYLNLDRKFYPIACFHGCACARPRVLILFRKTWQRRKQKWGVLLVRPVKKPPLKDPKRSTRTSERTGNAPPARSSYCYSVSPDLYRCACTHTQTYPVSKFIRIIYELHTSKI